MHVHTHLPRPTYFRYMRRRTSTTINAAYSGHRAVRADDSFCETPVSDASLQRSSSSPHSTTLVATATKVSLELFRIYNTY